MVLYVNCSISVAFGDVDDAYDGTGLRVVQSHGAGTDEQLCLLLPVYL